MIFKVLVGNEHGGAAVSSEEIINGFSESEFFFTVFLSRGHFGEKIKNKYKNVSVINSPEPPIISSPLLTRRLINYFRFVFWIIWTTILFISFCKKHGVKKIHTTNNHALLIVLLSKPFLKNSHVISHWRCVGLASTSLYKFLLKKIDQIICISYAVKNSLPPNLQKKSAVIYNGVDIDQVSINGAKNAGTLRGKNKLKPEDFLVGTIGSFTKIKCHELLIDSVKHLDFNFKLVLIGSCPNLESQEYKKHLMEKVKVLGLENNVFFLSDKEYFPPKDYITDLDVFVGATWNEGLGEGFGLIYIEAMAQKKPVIAIAVGAANEIIMPGETGILIKKNDPIELASSISFAYNNPEKMAELGWNGFKFAKEKFDVSEMLNNLNLVYKDNL